MRGVPAGAEDERDGSSAARLFVLPLEFASDGCAAVAGDDPEGFNRCDRADGGIRGR